MSNFLALDSVPAQSLSLPRPLICFMTCFKKSFRAPRSIHFTLLTPLRPCCLAHCVARRKLALASMKVDALWRVVRTTALRTLAPGFTVAACASFIPLRLSMWISNCFHAFPPEVPRKLHNRHRGHDRDGRLGANNDNSTISKPGPSGDYTLRVLFVLFQLRGLHCAALIIITSGKRAVRSPRPRSEDPKCLMYRATSV
jgi:hypothetical protein